MKIIFDLDGTLADCRHRLKYINGEMGKKDWDAFHKACVHDIPIEPVVDLYRQLYPTNHVRIWSGRNKVVWEETHAWLDQHRISIATVRMREIGDYRQDCIVKAGWLEALPKSEWPELVFDDRQQVVDMWRSHGIRCCQVAPGNF
jgi:FMN phosphatase YigB (HAD superfamily)